MMLDISITYFNRNNFQTLFVFFLRSRWIIRSDRRTYMARATAPSACLHTFSAYTCLKVCLHTKAVFSATLSCLFIYILYMCKQVCIWRCVCLRIPNFIPIKRSMRSRDKAKASAHLRVPLNAEYTIYLHMRFEWNAQTIGQWKSCQLPGELTQRCTKKCTLQCTTDIPIVRRNHRALEFTWQSAEQISMEHLTFTLATLYESQVNWCSIEI